MNKLKFWRIERSLSQQELAQASGIKRWAIQLIENGHREAKEFERLGLAITLGLEVSAIFGTCERVSMANNHEPK